MARKPFLPITFIFIIISLLIVILKFAVQKRGTVFNTVLAGNFVLFVATYFSFHFYNKGLGNPSMQVFLRTVYSAMFIKMGICIVAVLIYAFTVKPVSKVAILVFFGLYFIYTFAEVSIVTRLNKQNKNV
jgi:hypothetical protein